MGKQAKAGGKVATEAARRLSAGGDQCVKLFRAAQEASGKASEALGEAKAAKAECDQAWAKFRDLYAQLTERLPLFENAAADTPAEHA